MRADQLRNYLTGINRMHPLSNIKAKVDRVSEHFETLKSEIANFIDREPYVFGAENEPNRKAIIVRAQKKEEVPLRIRILAGEIVTQLRSVLDHLAWQLALLATTRPGNRCEFPIFESAASYKEKSPIKVAHIPIAARKIIDSLQPHACPNPPYHPLYAIHALANIEKHRLLTVATMGLNCMTCSIPAGTSCKIDVYMGPIEDQTEILVMTTDQIVDLKIDEEIGVEVEIALALVLDKWETPRNIELLIPELIDYVVHVVHQFESFFTS